MFPIKMYKCPRALLLLSFLISFHFSHAQDVVEDFGFWGFVSYGKDISKKFDLTIEQEIRLQNVSTELGRAFTNFGVDYKPEKWLNFGTNYRFILDRRPSGLYGIRHRLTADVVLKQQFKRISLAYRARVQWEIKGYNYSNEFGYNPAWDFRNRFKATYQMNRTWKPFLAADIRLLITDPNKSYITNAIDRFRIIAGTEYHMGKNRVLEFFILSSQEIQVIEPMRIYAVGIGYNFGSESSLLGT